MSLPATRRPNPTRQACPQLCRFSDAGDDDLAARCGGRRPKSAKARNRVGSYNGFDAGFSPYQSTRLNRYDAVSSAWGRICNGASSSPFSAARQRYGRSRRARSRRERMRRIGVLMDFAVDDPEGQARVAAFQQRLGELGWIVDRNVRIDHRWGATDVDRVRRYAAELVGLAPDVSWQVAPRLCGRCNRRPAMCRSCSRGSPIRSVVAWSQAWRDPAAIPPVLSISNTVSARMAGIAQADRSGRDANRDHSRPRWGLEGARSSARFRARRPRSRSR